MRLEELSKTGTLRKVKPNKQLIETALKKAHRDLRVSTTLIQQEEYDWAYTASYTAMPTAARALMNHTGYRPPSSDGHTAVVRILEAEEIDQDIRNLTIIDRMRRTRHRVMYDEYDIITEKTAKQAHTWANKFVTTIEKPINKT